LDNLERFGIIGLIDYLAGNDVTKWDTIGTLKLSYVLMKYAYDAAKTANEYKLQRYERNKMKQK
jgi:hypothetical protein